MSDTSTYEYLWCYRGRDRFRGRECDLQSNQSYLCWHLFFDQMFGVPGVLNIPPLRLRNISVKPKNVHLRFEGQPVILPKLRPGRFDPAGFERRHFGGAHPRFSRGNQPARRTSRGEGLRCPSSSQRPFGIIGRGVVASDVISRNSAPR